jgi:hypothetical protein
MVVGGNNMGIQHGRYWRQGETRMANLFLSILQTMGIEQPGFSDSTGTLSDSIFKRV